MPLPITIELPETVLQQLTRIAEMTHQPSESLVAQSVLNNLPPSPDNAPPELQQALLDRQSLNNEELKAISNGRVTPLQQERHEILLEKNQLGQITAAERQELVELRQAADQLMLKKAYAWSILRWRGQKTPTLNELPV
jgi:predicted transcriptional regulator